PVTGYAQVGVSGLSKVQIWVSPKGQAWPADDPYFTTAPWTNAHILPPPDRWGALPGNVVPDGTRGFDATTGRPQSWPMRLCQAPGPGRPHGLPAGEYPLRCRTIDAKGAAQPMPRPFRKSGRCDIEAVPLTVLA